VRRALVIIMLLGGGGVAAAAPTPEPAPPTVGPPDVRGRRHPLKPLELFYRDYDMERQNVGLRGRTNALRKEQYNSLDGWREPLSGWMR
jgi:hypothetical protein